MFESFFHQLRTVISWVLSIFQLRITTHKVEKPQWEQEPADSIPAYIFTEEDKRKGKLGIKRLKQKQLFARITKETYLQIRAKFTDNPMSTNQMLNRPLDEEDELFDKVKDYVICNMPEKNIDIWKPRK